MKWFNGLRLLAVGRQLHTSSLNEAVNKAALSRLRKRTGFPFINCKKALEKFDNDFKKAESWMRKQAQKEGWAKASKLGERPMSQGLVGILVEKNAAAMVEVNCETDFVARNKKFQGLVSAAATACLQYGQQSQDNKIFLDKATVDQVKSEDKTLADLVALEVGTLGENMALRRGFYVQVPEDTHIGTYVHAAGLEKIGHNQCEMGKYGALAVFQQETAIEGGLALQELGRQLAQHIVGMNPKAIGIPDDKPDSDSKTDSEVNTTQETEITVDKSNIEEENTEKSSVESSESKEKDLDSSEQSKDEENEKPSEEKEQVDESKLIFQEFLLDPDITAGVFLQQNASAILDFVRFECGEVLPGDED